MKVLVFPQDKNPYQDLLYKDITNRHDVQVDYYSFHKSNSLIINLVLFPLLLIKEKVKGYTIFHLHWLYNFSLDSSNARVKLFSQFFFAVYIPLCFLLIKIMGFKIIWTIHNIVPHEKQTINDHFITRFLTMICAKKIVHSKTTIKELQNIKADVKDTYVIPMGNFSGVYPNEITKTNAREKLKIDQNKKVFLFFGFIRKYKGVLNLMKVYSELQKKYPSSHLIIAGDSLDIELKKEIVTLSKTHSDNLHLAIKHIQDEDVQLYFNAADIVVYPFNKITTSSSVFLSMQFAKPIIYPRMGNLSELPENVGFSYEPRNERGLYKAMEKSLRSAEDLKKIGENGLHFSKSLTWSTIADKTYQVYQSVLKV